MAKEDKESQVVSGRCSGDLVRAIFIDLTSGVNPQLQTMSDAIRRGLELVRLENANMDTSPNREQNLAEAKKFAYNRILKHRRDMLALDNEIAWLKTQFGSESEGDG